MPSKGSLPTLLPVLALVLVPLLAAGCVSKSDHEALQAELAACSEAQARAEAEIISWEKRFDRESDRWEQLQGSVAEAVPRALSEMHEERQRIVDMVPDQVRGEVTQYLDEYFNTVMTGFDRMAQDSQDMRIELLATNKALEALGQDTRSIGNAIDESLADEKGRRSKVSQDLADIIDSIVEYDQTRLNCKGCDQRLRMRDKPREDLLAFHQDLMNDLASLQTFAAAPKGALPMDATQPTGTDPAGVAGEEGDAESGDVEAGTETGSEG